MGVERVTQMNQLYENIKKYRKQAGLTQEELAKKAGYTDRSSIAKIEAGHVDLTQSKIRQFAEIFGVTPSALMGMDTEKKGPPTLPAGLLPIEKRRIPILGPIAAGTPLTAEREYDNYISIAGDSHHADAALRVEGDSMTPRYLDGDLVLIRLQDDVDNGQIAAVCIDDCITLKRLYHMPHGVQLVSENPKYAPMMFDSNNSDSIRVMGLAVGYVRWEA